MKDRSDLGHVTTSVKNGVVQLTGTVESEWTARAARNVPGWRRDEDLLRVEPPNN